MDNEPEEKFIPEGKPVTLDDLAAMVQRGFQNVDKRFEQMDARFEKVDARLAHIDARLDSIERDIRDLVHREEFTDLMARVKYLEEKLNIESGK